MSAERGPEWEEMMTRHEREGVTQFHATKAHPGVTDEQVAAEVNRIDSLMRIPAYRMAASLRGRAFLLADSAACSLRQWDAKTLEPVDPSTLERIKAEDEQQFATLLNEAAEMLWPSTPPLSQEITNG